jgi:hypothetical protein
LIAAIMVVGGLWAWASPGFAHGGQNAAAQSALAESEMTSCAVSNRGQALIDCVGTALSSLSAGIDKFDVKKEAPQLISLAAQAGEIRSKPKAEALRVLNRVLAVTRSLATKSATDMVPAYNAVAGAFSRAISVIERKG